MLQIVEDDTDTVSVEIQSASSLPHVSRYRIATPQSDDDLGDVAVIDICCSPPSSPEAEVPDENVWTERGSFIPELLEMDLPDTARIDLNDVDDNDDGIKIVEDPETARVYVNDSVDSQRSVTLPSLSGRESYYEYEDDLGFVEGDDDVSERHRRSVTFLDQENSQERRQKHEDHYEKQRVKYKEKQEKMESMSKVNTRRQKFHRTFNFVRARYPGSQTPNSKGPKLPASLCPPTRYGKEARVAETRERTKKKGSWSSPPTYPAKQKSKEVACDCQIMKFVEKCDLAVQCSPYTQNVAIQCPMAMRTTATQYPRCKVKDHAVQMSGFGKVDVAVQNANSTRNVMVETCYKLMYSPNFVASEDVAIQCDEVSQKRNTMMVKKQYSEDLGMKKEPEMADAHTQRRASLPESTQAGSPLNTSRSNLSDDGHSNKEHDKKLRLINHEDNERARTEVVGLNDDDYSSDWDSGDGNDPIKGTYSSDEETPSIGPTMSHVSIAVREDAHS